MKRLLSLGRIPGRNILAHPARSAVLLLLVLVQTASVFSGLMLVRSLDREMKAAEARLGADILVYPTAAMSRLSADRLLMQGSPVEVWKDRSLLKRMKDCEGIEAVSCQLYLQDTTGDKPVWIVCYDPAEDFVIAPWAPEGASRTLPEGAVLAGCAVEEKDGTVGLFGRSWHIYDRLTETDSEMDEMVFVNPATFSLLIEAAGAAGKTSCSGVDPETDFSAALLKVGNKEELDSITGWLNVYVRKVKAIRSQETLTETAGAIRGQSFLAAGITAGTFGLLLLAQAIAQSVMMRERKKEFFLWSALGASRGTVRRLMLRESALVSAAGGVLGAGTGLLLTRFLFKRTPDFAGMATAALAAVCLSVLAGCGAAAYAVHRTAGRENGQMLTL